MSLFTVRPVEAHRMPCPAAMTCLHAQPTIPAGQIWPHLTDEQQQFVLRTVVVVCRSLLNRPPTDGDAGGCDEQP
jgi:hypothetical protein